MLNRSFEFLNLLSLDTEVQGDINSDVHDFLIEYVKKLEEEEMDGSAEDKELPEEEALKDKSAEISTDQENPMDIKKALESPFYKISNYLSFDICTFEPCLKFELNGSKVLFSRSDLRIKEIVLELSGEQITDPNFTEGNKKSLEIKFNEYGKIAGKYFLPKRIKLITETNQLLFKFENLSLKKLKKVKFKESKVDELNQILSI